MNEVTMNSPIEFWREQGAGVMLMVRLPDGGEAVYMGAANRYITRLDIEQTVQWLQGLKGGIVNA